MGLKIGYPIMTQESDVCKVDEYVCAMIQCIESIIDRVVNKFTHLRSLRDHFLGGPILGLFLSPFLRV